MENRSHGDEGEERGRQLVVARGDAAMLFQGAEEVLYPVTFAVAALVKGTFLQPFRGDGKAGKDVILDEARPQSVGVVSFVADQRCTARALEGLEEFRGGDRIGDIARGQNERD